MNVLLQPTETRFGEIEHCGWGCRWVIQLPEAVNSRQGCAMSYPAIRPAWVRRGEGAWEYEWRTTPEYVQGVTAFFRSQDPEGERFKTDFAVGLALHVGIEAGDDEARLTLAITNESSETFEDVRSEGGCLQARGEAFTGGEETARSRILVGGQMVSMADLHRTNPVRCQYLSEPGNEENWFWGRSSQAVDCPVIVGAISRDDGKAVTLGYENARYGLQNADDHHCLHSCPFFGRISPGQCVTRRGWILFGEDLPALAAELARRLV